MKRSSYSLAAGHRYPAQGCSRVLIEGVSPQVDHGRFPAKRVVGDCVEVQARIFADGHDVLSGRLLFRHYSLERSTEAEQAWSECDLEPLPNDWWRGSFVVSQLGHYFFTLEAWVDRFATWRRDLRKRVDAGQDVSIDLLVGVQIVREHLPLVPPAERKALESLAARIETGNDRPTQVAAALSPHLADVVGRHADRRHATRFEPELPLEVNRPLARFSTWYELFPRSCSPHSAERSTAAGQHGTLADCLARLPYVAEMGFDVLYLPPIHPIGRSFRKGKNNAVAAAPDDVGSPWAIGAAEGGHQAVHPDLGTIDDFRRLVAKARELGIEIALDIAFQCAPDHPYVSAHPDWFRRRPDGSIQYAENPPKKYQDIYPFDFECDDWQNLWEELNRVLLFWCAEGVRVFRVDNPHTKSLLFWEWVIAEVKSVYPETIFLSEAFTRPAVMYRLAKLGFTQSYTYFTWRNTKPQITAYFTELTQSPVREFFQPNLWPNTPDILSEYLQFGGRSAFMARYVLAATLAASCGIYGPAFELCIAQPREPGSEEYLDSEKYQIRHWDLEAPYSLRPFIARVNRIRRENPALHGDWSLRFHPVDNEQLICYSKRSADGANVVVVVVNLDPHHMQAGWIELPLDELDVQRDQPYQAHDLLGDGRFLWQGPRNYVELSPHAAPAHIFCLRKRVRTESQFEYFL
ncbi:MAG TPA: alpha-1,4-glucan--maltose-1-phosphate maltosyltransferase [Pirellulaceae bacterium]|nr:alpha-1,4-glucan--maltose-1-phosphate maltosyltransferase [Pirellulaceae bacterium]